MSKNIRRTGFTLFEVITVMIIIAIIVGVSLKLAKTKLNNIKSYTYYYAYNTLSAATREMLSNFKTDDDIYMLAYKLRNEDLFGKIDTINYYLLTPIAHAVDLQEDRRPNNNIDCELPWIPQKPYNPGEDPDPHDQHESDDNALQDDNAQQDDGNGNNGDGNNGGGNNGDGNNGDGNNGGGNNGGGAGGGDGDITCPDGYQIRVIDGNQSCVPTPVTIPRRGQNFCRLLASYTNTITSGFNDGQECRGDSFFGNINGDDVSFEGMRPDLVLRNGMRIYNLNGSPYDFLQPLQNNSRGRIYYNDAGTAMDIDTSGYIAFVDIDGSSGTSTLWQDVFPFFITMSGKVIPAYRNNAGASNKEHLSVSAYNEIVNDGGRRINWLVRSVSFKEAACASGYINAATPYCTQAPSTGLLGQCAAVDSDCKIKVIAPIKWFN